MSELIIGMAGFDNSSCYDLVSSMCAQSSCKIQSFSQFRLPGRFGLRRIELQKQDGVFDSWRSLGILDRISSAERHC